MSTVRKSGSSDEQNKNRQRRPLTINTDKMSECDIDQAISDAQHSGHELHMSDKIGKVSSIIVEKGGGTRLELSDLELVNNLNFSTEMVKKFREKNRRS